MNNFAFNILLFSPYLPSTDTTACARKIYDSIKALYEKGHHIYLLSFCGDRDKIRINAISRYCKQIYLEHNKDYFRYPEKSANLSKNIEFLCKNKIVDILQCENSYLSRYIPLRLNIPSVLVEHEVLSSSFHGRSKFEKNYIHKLVWYCRSKKKIIEERSWYLKFNKIIIFTHEDKGIIENKYKIKNISIIPLGINSREYSSVQAKEKPYDLVFVGNFSHIPNTNAVLDLYKNILPLLRKSIPDISLAIGGANPPLCIKRMADFDKNIIVTGYTQNINKIYSEGKVFVAPIRFGTGMRFKILEAMASGIPVVTTSLGARGIMPKESLEIADSKKEFADRVINLLNDHDKYKKFAENGRFIIQKHYDWNIVIEKYENIYYDLIRQRNYEN